METPTAQLRVKPRCIIAEGSGGTIFWATPRRARLLIDSGAVVLMNAGASVQPVIGPGQTKPAGPNEIKEAEIKEPAEKKSSAAVPAGPSTDSASSRQHGAAAPLSASAEAPASPPRRPHRRAP